MEITTFNVANLTKWESYDIKYTEKTGDSGRCRLDLVVGNPDLEEVKERSSGDTL